MSTIIWSAGVFVALGLGYLVGMVGKAQTVQRAVDLTIATFGLTASLWYGEDWMREFMAEAQNVQETERTTIVAMALAMQMARDDGSVEEALTTEKEKAST